MKSEFLRVAQKVLETEKRPMRPTEIVSEALRKGFFSDKISGKTPHQTMKSKLSVHVRKRGGDSIFVRTSPGKFFLRNLLNSNEEVYLSPPFSKPKSDERVMVFDNDWFDEKKRFQGIKPTWKKLLKEINSENVFSYMNRLEAENDNGYKQVLTYIMVTRKKKILSFKRGNFNRVEDFLKGLRCIGFGGHVAQDDNNLFSKDKGITDCAIRELKEEIRFPKQDKKRLELGRGLSCVGVLNDDSSIVGQRHIAFIFKYEVSGSDEWIKPVRGENSITQLHWLDADTKFPISDFEYWSQLCLTVYFPNLISTAPKFKINRKGPLKSPHVLCVLGGVGSGKSETTKYLCSNFGYKEINTGKLMAKLLGIQPIPITLRASFQKKANKYIKTKHGLEALANEILNEAKKLNHSKVLIEGIRQRSTLKKIKEKFKETFKETKVGVIYVHTPHNLAYEFYKKRENPDISIFDFLKIRGAEVENEVEDMIGLSDAVLYNWTGQDRYRQAIKAMMKALNSV